MDNEQQEYLNKNECYVYIIRNEYGGYYTGITNNISKRLSQHNSKMSNYTAFANNWVIVHSSKYETRKKAAKMERYVKNCGAEKYIIKLKYGPNKK